MRFAFVRGALAVFVMLACAEVSLGGVITYTSLLNKPGANHPPAYGLRLDGMFNNITNGGSWVWNFATAPTGFSSPSMSINTNTGEVNVSGYLFGYKDLDQSNLTESNSDVWFLDFTFQNARIDDFATGWWSEPTDNLSTGTLELVDTWSGSLLKDYEGETVALEMKSGVPNNLRTQFADDGVTAGFTEAWLFSSDSFGDTVNRGSNKTRDFAFRALSGSQTVVPEPATLTIFAMCGLAGLRRRRR